MTKTRAQAVGTAKELTAGNLEGVFDAKIVNLTEAQATWSIKPVWLSKGQILLYEKFPSKS